MNLITRLNLSSTLRYGLLRPFTDRIRYSLFGHNFDNRLTVHGVVWRNEDPSKYNVDLDLTVGDISLLNFRPDNSGRSSVVGLRPDLIGRMLPHNTTFQHYQVKSVVREPFSEPHFKLPEGDYTWEPLRPQEDILIQDRFYCLDPLVMTLLNSNYRQVFVAVERKDYQLQLLRIKPDDLPAKVTAAVIE